MKTESGWTIAHRRVRAAEQRDAGAMQRQHQLVSLGEHLLSEDTRLGRQARWRVEDADHIVAQAVGDESAERVPGHCMLRQHGELPGRR